MQEIQRCDFIVCIEGTATVIAQGHFCIPE